MTHGGGLEHADPAAARAEAARVLDQTSRRWRHVVGVATRAQGLAGAVPPSDGDLLVAAAWLHDIGYGVLDTGLHALDGARHLRARGAHPRLCRLVAHHTGAIIEARARGLDAQLLTEFPLEHSEVADALTYADLTTGADGQPVTVSARLEEILHRYPAGHVVHQSIQQASPALTATAARVEHRLRKPPTPR